MRRRVKGRINAFLVNPNEIGEVYTGVSEEEPNDLSMRLDSYLLTLGDLRTGFEVSYETSAAGEFEIFAYPKEFGRLISIMQNNIGINIIEAWTVIEAVKNDREYYLYYLTMPQYEDISSYVFTL